MKTTLIKKTEKVIADYLARTKKTDFYVIAHAMQIEKNPDTKRILWNTFKSLK